MTEDKMVALISKHAAVALSFNFPEPEHSSTIGHYITPELDKYAALLYDDLKPHIVMDWPSVMMIIYVLKLITNRFGKMYMIRRFLRQRLELCPRIVQDEIAWEWKGSMKEPYDKMDHTTAYTLSRKAGYAL